MYSGIYRVQSSTRRLPIRALFGFTLKLVESYPSPSPQSLCVVVCPWCQPWVASLMARLRIPGLIGAGFVPLKDQELTSSRFRSHSVDFASLRSPQCHLASSTSGVQDLEGCSFPVSRSPRASLLSGCNDIHSRFVFYHPQGIANLYFIFLLK